MMMTSMILRVFKNATMSVISRVLKNTIFLALEPTFPRPTPSLARKEFQAAKTTRL
jgi:hypothetical protein